MLHHRGLYELTNARAGIRQPATAPQTHLGGFRRLWGTCHPLLVGQRAATWFDLADGWPWPTAFRATTTNR